MTSRGPTWHKRVQGALQVLWFGVLPLLLALVVLRFLIPADIAGPEGVVSRVADRFDLVLGVALFFAFSLSARYWRFHVPGGRYASPLPASLAATEKDPGRLSEWSAIAALEGKLASPALGARLRQTLTPGSAEVFERHRSELGSSLDRGDLDAARNAARAIEDLGGVALARQRRREWASLAATVAAALGTALALRAFVVQPYRVLSASMLPTLEPADYVLGNRLAYAERGGPAVARGVPRRGDIVVFRSDAVDIPNRASMPDMLVKRVIGLPGDLISMHGDVPVINGWEVPYCEAGKYLYVAPSGETLQGRVRVEYVDDREYTTLQSRWYEFEGAYLVQPGEVFVLGDNRSNSLDSRAWNAGRGAGVPLDAIAGRAQWFLVGVHRSGALDWNRLLRPIDRLEGRLHIEGMDAQRLADGLARCLKNRPAATRPPEPAQPQASR